MEEGPNVDGTKSVNRGKRLEEQLNLHKDFQLELGNGEEHPHSHLQQSTRKPTSQNEPRTYAHERERERESFKKSLYILVS